MRLSVISVIVATSLLVISCGESRVAQCNKLTLTINKADAATESAKTDQPATLLQAASGLDQVVQELKTVEVKDEKLQGLRASFILTYEDISQLFRNTAIATYRRDRLGLESYRKSWQEANQQDGVLVQDLNSYCGGK